MSEAERSRSIEEWLHIVDISNPARQGKCASLPFGDGLNCSGNTDPGGLHFTGKKHDIESGLDYFGARYYDENVGRFTSPDPAGMRAGSVSNPQSWNQYAYVLNNPLSLTDPTGLDHNLTGCGQTNTLNCQDNVSGTYDSMGVFSPTVIIDSSSSDGTDQQQTVQNANGDIATVQTPVTTVTVKGGDSVWKKIGSWFVNARDSLSYAATAFIITHSNLAMEGNKSSFEYWSKQSDEDIIKSLNPGGKEPMQIRMEGENARILNGNMRFSILQSRGADTSGLQPEVLPPAVVEPPVEPIIEPEIIP